MKRKLKVDMIKIDHIKSLLANNNCPLKSFQAQKISKYFCNYFDLDRVSIIISKRKVKRRYGTYFWPSSKIILYCATRGNNIITLLHELSHHREWCNFKQTSHRKTFVSFYNDAAKWYQKEGKECLLNLT